MIVVMQPGTVLSTRSAALPAGLISTTNDPYGAQSVRVCGAMFKNK
ncbi:hypothetical protein [Methanoculleus sp.]|nr:hypothetical protein [Methanoculleus sp.]